MKKILSLFLLHVAVFTLTAQPAWFQFAFGDCAVQSGRAVIQLPSGSILFMGFTDCQSGNYYDITITKLDAQGNMLWDSAYGTAKNEFGNRMLLLNDTSLIICGQSSDVFGNSDGLIIRVDTSGNLLQLKSFGSPDVTEVYHGICAGQDGGFYICGFVTDTATNIGNNILLSRFSAEGELYWEKSLGLPAVNEAADNLIQLPDGSLVLTNDELVDSVSNTYNANLYGTDSAGNLLWKTLLENDYNSGCKNLFRDSGGDIVVIGESYTQLSNAFDVMLCKSDESGNLKWVKTIPLSGEGDAGFAVYEPVIGFYLLTGYGFDTLLQQTRINLLLTDSSGNLLFQSFYSNSNVNIGYDIQPANSGGFLLAGTDFINQQYYLVHDPLPLGLAVEYLNQESNDVILFPNPASKNQPVFILASESFDRIEIVNLSGEVIHSNKFPDANNSVHLSPDLSPGIYFINLQSEKLHVTKKLVIQ